VASLHSTANAADLSTTELRGLAQTIVDQGNDPDAMQRSLEFLDLTETRLWTYHTANGLRTHQDVFDRQETRNGEIVVVFKRKYVVPLRLLSEKDRLVIYDLNQLRTQVIRDFNATRRQAEQLQIAKAEEAERQAKAEELEEKRMSIRRVRIVRPTYAQIQLGKGSIEKKLLPNEEFDVLASTKSFVKIEVAGRPAMVPKADVAEIASRPSDDGPIEYLTGKPTDSAVSLIGDAAGDDLPPTGLEASPTFKKSSARPIELDIDIDIVPQPDRIHIIVNEVHEGGVGHRLKIRPGEVIELIDGQRIRGMDDLREHLLDGPPLKLHVRNSLTGQMRVIQVGANGDQQRLEFGAVGRANDRG